MVSGDEEEDDLEDAAADSVSDLEVKQASEDDELALLLRDNARLRAEEAALTAQRVAKLRRDNELRAARIAALQQAGVDDGTAPSAAVAAAAAGEQTPPRAPPPRRSLFHSATGRRPPNATTVARQASIDQLPDIAPVGDTVSVVVAPIIAPAVAGSGRASNVTHVLPAASEANRAPYRATVSKPEKFSGDDPVQNQRVASWVAEINRFLRLSKVPIEDHLDTARSYVVSKGSAEEWITAKEEEVACSGKQLTWVWLQAELIQHYAQPSGPAAMQAEWQALRMGIKGADGMDTGKSTWTVQSYTNRFLHYLRQLTEHTAQTSDILVIDRYVQGIRTGYEPLYTGMLGVQKVLRFASLQEAITAAEEAEADISIVRNAARTSAPYSSSSFRYRDGAGRASGSDRAATESLNNLQGSAARRGKGRRRLRVEVRAPRSTASVTAPARATAATS